MKPLVVSFHTGQEPYPSFARRLAASCERHGLEYRIDELPDRGAWVENVAARGPFLWERMRELDRPLLWIDADGEVEAEPTLLYGTEADFAVHTVERGWEFRPVGRGPMTLPAAWPRRLGPQWFLGGTLFFHRTPAAKELLELWAAECTARPRDYQQWLLQDVWCRVPRLETLWLPQGYCKIRGHRWREGEQPRTVIGHDLASAILEDCVRA